MDDPIFKTKYQKYKCKVKLWEKDFKEKNGRIPSKHDIREAPIAIRDSYKMYYKLKTSFLEETLSEALEDDSFDLSILESSSQTDTGCSFSQSEVSAVDVSQLTNTTFSFLTDRSEYFADVSASSGNEFNKTLSEIVADSVPDSLTTKKACNDFEAEKFEALNEKAWGANVSNIVKNDERNDSKLAEMGAKVRENISNKLFKNSSFSKRNPRKSLSRTSLRSSSSFSSLSGSQKEILPDLETILAQKSQQTETEPMPSKGVLVGNASSSGSTLGNQIDMQWLNRCSKTNSLEPVEVAVQPTPSTSTETRSKYGISNINVSALQKNDAAIAMGSMAGNKSMLSFDMCNLNIRKSDAAVPTENKYSYSDEDEIANSEEESKTDSLEPEIRSIRHVLKKRKLNETATSPDSITRKPNENTTSSTDQPANEIGPMKKPPQKKKVKVTRKRAIVAVSTVRRRSSRVSKVVQKKVERFEYDSNESIEEIDPFAEDDSDGDPDFGNDKTHKQTQNANEIDSNSSANSFKDDALDKKPKALKTKIVKKSKTKTVKVTAAKQKTKRTIVNKKKPTTGANGGDEEGDEENFAPEDYQIEFGMDRIKSVPRIDITELKRSTEVFTKYVSKQTSTIGISAKPSGSGPVIGPNIKRALDREQLTKKMESGSLNENYRQINLRKKVFVRGKKTVNFSRYKKTLWRQKKAAALTGPEMDMGGCDGGILTCFQCGQPGHFAQNCKVKSDRLLPLSADIEESPFPTLEEIEQISNEKLQAVHGNQSIPAANNPLWKEQISDSEAMDIDDVAGNEIDDDVEASRHINKENVDNSNAAPAYIGHKIPDDFLMKAGLLNDSSDMDSGIKPLYSLNSDGSLKNTPKEVNDALRMFGHDQFRPGQEKAIMRILSGQSSLVTLSTGSGKSLCYQLPAYLFSKHFKCITLVISPLVSLMEDQVQGMPDFLNAQCLHTNQNKEKRQRTMDMIKAGSVDILLVAPEQIVAAEKSTGFGSLFRELPPIAFVCIDEAHCVSQWSHNFRPSYLMVCQVLQETLKVKTILGLTATATRATRQSIVKHLAIPDGLDGVISDIPLPDNLTLTISCDDNRDLALMRLLKHEKFQSFKSIIIYCTRRDECESVAKTLRTIFQDNVVEAKDKKGKRKRGPRSNIEPYHAGMPASRRKTIQNAFMRGDLKIVVATIAFGMGINKSDIRAVIHYNMPNNFERYVQEVGRAGRDGKMSHCHLFLDARGGDKMELRRHIFANSIDRHIIRKLLHKVFIPCACVKNVKRAEVSSYQSDIDAAQSINWTDDMECSMEETVPKRICPGHEVCFSIDATVNELDIPEENIATLLCYLELHEKRFIKTLSKAYTMCKVLSYGGAKALRTAAQSCPPLAMAIALDLKKGITHDSSTFIEFPVIDIASAIGWNSGVVKYQLKNLEWTTVNGAPKRSAISVDYSDLGFRIRAPGDLSDEELDATLDMLYNRVQSQEKTQLMQLDNVFKGLSSVARKSCIPCANVDEKDENSEQLKKLVREYFQSDETQANFELTEEPMNESTPDGQIISDIRTMIGRYPENNFTGRSLARIFHGVSSPVYPAVIWGRCKQWRSHIKTDFNRIVSLANAEIVKIRT